MAFQPVEDVINCRMPQYRQDLDRFKNRSKAPKVVPPVAGSIIDLGDEEDITEPVTPNFLQNNVTIESVINLYNKGMLSMTLLSDEGGTFVGSRAMSRDSYINTLSAFNTLLSGDSFSKSTIKGGEALLVSRRLTFMMYMQPQIFDEFIKKCGNISDAGFMQRTLIIEANAADSDVSGDYLINVLDSFCEKQIPKNIYDDDAYREYKELVAKLLDMPLSLNEYGLLSPPTIEPSMEAKCAWFKFYVKQKRIIKDNIEFSVDAMNSFRERAPETASRLATLFQLAENHGRVDIEISGKNMENAIKIVEQSLETQFKIYDVQDSFFAMVDLLTNWYKKRDEAGKLTRMKLRQLSQSAPKQLRKKDLLVQILEYLQQEGIVTYDGLEYIYIGLPKV